MRKNEGRTVGLFTKVSPEEKEVIDKKMALLGTSNLRGYLRKMAVDGYIVQLNMECVKELVRLLRSISSNVNQITRRCNETRNLYAQDVEDLRQGYDRVWHEVYDLIRKFEGSLTRRGGGSVSFTLPPPIFYLKTCLQNALPML